MHPNTTDLTGQKFGRLTALSSAGSIGEHIHWWCQCSCGKTALIRCAALLTGHTKSCDCLKPQRQIGESMSYSGAHNWLKNNKPKPEFCQRCREQPPTELSYKNTEGQSEGYYPNKDDYEWLCQSCHAFKDNGSNTIMTKARVHRIREFYRVKAATQRELGRLFKISHRVVNKIIHCQGIYQREVNNVQTEY